MNKHRRITIVIAVVVMTLGNLAIASCNKIEESSAQYIDYQSSESKILPLTDYERKIIAENFSISMANYPNSYEELYNAIEVVRSYGLDEQIYIYDIVNTEYSVFLHTTQELSDLREVISDSRIIELSHVDNLPFYGQLQLYWPYHDSWDHVVSPTIIFEPESEDAATVVGFRVVNGEIVPIELKVDNFDDYYTQGIFIIIKEAEFNYNIYPEFKNGVYTKNGQTWVRPTNITGQDGTLCYEDQTTTGDTVYEASVYKYQCNTGQRDSWFFGGGSEFAVLVARLLPNGTSDTHTYTFELTRKEIRDNTVKVFQNPLYLHPNWLTTCGDIYYRYFERDGGGSVIQDSVNLSYQGVSVSVTIEIKPTDDYIGSGTLIRTQYMNWCQTGNNVNGLGSNDNFWFKMRTYSSI